MISYFLRTGVNVYSFLILVYILASWIPECHSKVWYQYIYRYVNPCLALFRKFIPRIGFIDISPLIALFCLEAVPFIVIRVLYMFITHVLRSPWLLQYL